MRRYAGLVVAFAMAVAALGLSPGAASAASFSPWVYNPTTHHYYAQVDGVNWADAEAVATKVGGHLVTVNDQAEQDWLTAMFPQPWLWIGLNDRTHEGDWVWSSGQTVRYTNWLPGEPDNWKGYDPYGEDAAVLNMDIAGWGDISGEYLASGIVETPGRPRALTRNNLPIGTHDGSVDEYAIGDACNANGWAFDTDSPKRDVTVRLLATRLDIFSVPLQVWSGPAGQFREDLLVNGFGDGTASFWVDLRGLIEYGLPYQIIAQGRDVQTGEWRTLDESPRSITCMPY